VGGWTKEVRLGADRGDAVDAGRAGALIGSQPRLVLPYWTDPGGNLTLEVDQVSDRIDRDLVRMPLDDTRFEGGRVQVGLPLRTSAGCDVPVRFTRVGEGSTVDLPGRLEPTPAGSRLTVDTSPGLGSGAWWMALGIPSVVREVPHWAKVPIEVGATTGSLRPTKVTPPRAPRGKPAVLAPLTDYAKRVRRRLRRMRSTSR
jgi:hypothetical protein